MAQNDPSTPSFDYEATESYLKMIAAIRGGVKTMREAGTEYLPRNPAETVEAYDLRRQNARFTNIFADITSDLSMRPFQNPMQLGENTTERFQIFATDVDAKGNDLNTFAARLFRAALEDGVTWVLTDYTNDTPQEATVAEERASGARAFWVHYRAGDVLAVYSDRVQGEERIVHARLRETAIERDGFDEIVIERIRMFDQREDMESPEWTLWRKRQTKADDSPSHEWEIEEGPTPLTIDRIPLVPVIFGQRDGNSWRVDPPLRDAAFLQLELYQQENGLKHARVLTAYPMLAANGIEPERDDEGKPKVGRVGPSAVLYSGENSGANGRWEFIEPAATSLQFLREDIRDTIRELRELGRQPLTAQSGNLTAITTAVAAQKGNSAIQVWAQLLGNALQICFELTAQWLNIDEFELELIVNTDFDVGFGDDASFKLVLEMGKGPEPIVSRPAIIDEAKRRGILGPHFDAEADAHLLDERMDEEPEEDEPPDDEGGDDDDDEGGEG